MTTVRVATYNIHKGVQGVGPLKRLEIHNLVRAAAALQADVFCLQEVRVFPIAGCSGVLAIGRPAIRHSFGLAKPVTSAVYRTNAVTRHGEHGNALLSRFPVLAQGHQDVSDHRFEQRGCCTSAWACRAARVRRARRARLARRVHPCGPCM